MTTDEIDELPPRLPETLPEVERAVMLCGAVAQGQALRTRHREELAALVGAIPSRPLAVAWKRVLKVHREELLEELP